MSNVRTVGMATLSLLLIAGVGVAALGPPVDVLPHQMALHGKFTSLATQHGPATKMPWSVELWRDADQVAGRIAVAGLQDFEAGNVQAMIAWPSVVGQITEGDGDVVATFEGHLVLGGIAGTFAAMNGDAGSWSWSWPAEP